MPFHASATLVRLTGALHRTSPPVPAGAHLHIACGPPVRHGHFQSPLATLRPESHSFPPAPPSARDLPSADALPLLLLPATLPPAPRPCFRYRTSGSACRPALTTRLPHRCPIARRSPPDIDRRSARSGSPAPDRPHHPLLAAFDLIATFDQAHSLKLYPME